MQNTRFSFGTTFPTSQHSPLPTTLPQTKTHQSPQHYKQKYFECKQNIKQFMVMVEKEFQELMKRHNVEKDLLKGEIVRLKRELGERNDVSSFTVRSKRDNGTANKSQRNKSMSQQNNQSGNTLSFEGISAFDQSKIHSRTKSIVDKNLSSISHPNTLIELQNALNSKHSSRISSRTVSLANENALSNTQNNSSSNVTQYTNQILGKRNKRLEEQQKKQDFDALMEKMIQKNINSQAQKEKSKILEKTDYSTICAQSRLTQRNHPNKQNLPNELTNRTDHKSKPQQTSVRNLLKTLRSSMKNNIEKQSHLEATTLASVKA